jgi:uncharacterized protein YbjT (DUF2867 family)
MNRILVTGGDGNLGRAIVTALVDRGSTARVMSRGVAPAHLRLGVEWVQADVITGDGIDRALDQVDAIVNCLSSPAKNTYETDVLGTARLLSRARSKGVRRVVQISIIGIDRIILPYYQYKLAAELSVIESGVPYLIARIAQFHRLVDFVLSPLRDVAGDTVAIPVESQFQPIHTRDVAAHLAPVIVDGDHTGRLPDFGGPEVLTLAEIVPVWLAAQGLRKTIIPAITGRSDLPSLDRFGDGFVQGHNTCPDQRVPGVTWADYLRETYGTQA